MERYSTNKFIIIVCCCFNFVSTIGITFEMFTFLLKYGDVIVMNGFLRFLLVGLVLFLIK